MNKTRNSIGDGIKLFGSSKKKNEKEVHPNV